MREYKLYIGGRWQKGPETEKITSPFDQQVVGIVHQAGKEEVESALNAAKDSFGKMRHLPAFRRAEALQKISQGVAERKDELAKSICLEAGKPITEARVEVGRVVTTFQTAAEEAKRIGGEVVPLDLIPGNEGRMAIVRRFPIGPILGITPFNFPLNLVAHKIAPAIASGNTIILKPAPKTPITALILAEIIDQSGLPPGTVNVVPTSNEMAERLVLDDRIKMISFTGSAPVGWMLKSKSGKKRVVLELGGNAGVIVHHDADIDLAATRCGAGGFTFAGQVCISVQRILVHEEVVKPFVEKLGAIVGQHKMGNPMKEDTKIGPMINPQAAERTEQWVKEAVQQGAKIVVGGNRRDSFFEPTVLTDVNTSMKVCSEEAFAPLVTVMSYQTFEEAIKEINHSSYGLQAGVFTRDLSLAFMAYREIEVGSLMINEVPAFRVDSMPYGGVKDSGFGREGLRYAIESMTEPRLLALKTL